MPKKPGQDPVVPGIDPTAIDTPEQPATPVEKARALVEKTRKEKVAEVERQAAEDQQIYEGMKERRTELETETIRLQTTRDQLKEALAVFSEMDSAEMTEEIRSEMADYEDQIGKIDLTLAQHAAELKDIEESPLFIRLQAEEQKRETESRIKESKAALEKRHEQATRELQALAEELKITAKNWEQQQADTKQIIAREMELGDQYGRVAPAFREEVSERVRVLPPEQRRPIFDLLFDSNPITQEKFDQVVSSFKPSTFPFFDRPLKALLALRKDPRLEEVRMLQAQCERAAEDYIKARNNQIDFATKRVRRLMMESPLLSSIKESSSGLWQTLQFSEVPEGHVPLRQEAWQKILQSTPFIEGMVGAVGYGEDAGLQMDFLNRINALKNLALRHGK